MKPEDILNAIGDVDDAYIRKAHKKSFFKALAVFLVILTVGITMTYRQMPDFHLLLRYQPDGSVLTGYVEPEVLLYDSWTSMEYTAYDGGNAVSTTRFHKFINSDYRITRTETETSTTILGTNGGDLSPRDYVGSIYYTNLYLTALLSTDLLDRVDMVYLNSQMAYGVINQQLNCITLEYLQRSDFIHDQIRYNNGRTPEESAISSRGYDIQIDKYSGWKEWDTDGDLLAYAEYVYDGNTQTVSTYLADGTLTGTRISKYASGNLKWREYYDPSGALIGREVYHYRIWEPFLCPQGILILIAILSLAVTFGYAVWDDRIKFGDRLLFRSGGPSREDAAQLRRSMDDLTGSIRQLTGKLEDGGTADLSGEITALTDELEEMNNRLSQWISGR